MKKYSLLLLVWSNVFWAQTTAKIENVETNGLHRIYLDSGITSYSREDLADLRIYDAKQTEIPYVFPQPTYDGYSYKFVPFHIVEKSTVPKKSTSIVVENPMAQIDEFTLYIANAEVTKKFTVSGSNDNKQWFGIVNNAELSDIKNERTTSQYKSITFPLTAYRYLKIDLDDRKTLPINILSAGYFKNQKRPQQRFEILHPKLTTTEKKIEKQTLIAVDFEKPTHLSSIWFVVSEPNIYKRGVRIYKNVTHTVRRKTQTRQEGLLNFELASDKNNWFETLDLFEKEFFIAIDNRDNPPLQFSKIEFLQQLPYIVADLKAGESYTLETGKPSRTQPDYDLSAANPKLFDSIPEAKLTQLKHTDFKTTSASSETKSFWQQSWFMWLCISLGGLVIAYFTTSLVRDMK